MADEFRVLPPGWLAGYTGLPAGFWTRSGARLRDLCPEIDRIVTERATFWNAAEALALERAQFEQDALGAFAGARAAYGCLGAPPRGVVANLEDDGVRVERAEPWELWALRWLCGADKPRSSRPGDRGERADGWFGIRGQIDGLYARFVGGVYRGRGLSPERLQALGRALPRDLRGLVASEACGFAPGRPVRRGGREWIPATRGDADLLRYSVGGHERHAAIVARYFAEDPAAPREHAPETPSAPAGRGAVIVLDAGHPLPAGGAHGVGGNEARLNGRIRDALAPLLMAAGHTVLLAPRTNEVGTIGAWSAARRPDVFLSIHHNAAADGAARGAECYCAGIDYGGAPDCAPKGRALATAVVAAVMAEFGIPAHGAAVRDRWIDPNTGRYGRLGVLRGGDNWAVSGAACLIEMMFVSSPKDAEHLAAPDYPGRAAAALFRGIQAYLGEGQGLPPAPEPVRDDPDVAEYRALVRALQTFLREHGHDPGPVDGLLGPRTARAAEDYQEQAEA